MKLPKTSNLTSSFRDPSGHIFTVEGNLYRQINHSYKNDYAQLMSSGLYKKLVERGLLIPHKKADLPPQTNLGYEVIQPERVPLISYPYEWCFSQLKDAALLTLEIQLEALKHGMSLKDASAYNVQFRKGSPVLIDTLSFEKYENGKPWIAYKQYSQHFLAPLALISKTDSRLGLLSRLFIDGVPLDLASQLLPIGTKFNPALMVHLHMQAKSQKHFEARKLGTSKKISKPALIAFLQNLKKSTANITTNTSSTEWENYYSDTNYSKKALKHKKKLVEKWAREQRPEIVWDLGANDGTFSRILTNEDVCTIAFDIDPKSVEKNYLISKKIGDKNMLPLIMDLTNPSTDLGWANNERTSLVKRGKADLVLALGLIHHLRIGNNVPFEGISHFLSRITKKLIVEFIPKDDNQISRLLITRKDIFQDYSQKTFEESFEKHFEINKKEGITNSDRIMYLMKAKKQ